MSKKLLFTLGVACLAMTAFTTAAHAQYGSLPLGTVQNTASAACPGSGWYAFTDKNGSGYSLRTEQQQPVGLSPRKKRHHLDASSPIRPSLE